MKMLVRGLVGLVVAGALSVGFGGAVGASATSGAGAAVVVTGEGSSTHRNSGGSATPFSLALPHGAACPGDSRNGGYRVQSFIVPATTDPATLRYKSTGPDGAGLYPLFDIYTHGFVQVQTANADVPNGPGLIIDTSTFDYKVFPPGTLAAGSYHIGIACTLIDATVRYWSVDIVLTASASDRPAGFRWSVAIAPPSGSRGSSATIIVAAIVVLAAVVVGSVLLRRRRSSIGA